MFVFKAMTKSVAALFFIFQFVKCYNVEFNTSVDRSDYKYQWEKFLPNSAGFLDFRVQVKTDAHIALVSEPSLNDPKYVISIGAWINTRSVIKRNREKEYVADHTTAGYLSETEFRGFWIQWSNGAISVGRAGETDPFMKYTDPNPFPILYVGFATPFPGSWIVETNYRWVPNNQPMHNKFIGGKEQNDVLYVIRAQVENSLIPGKLLNCYEGDIVTSDRTEFFVTEFEVLTDLVGGEWVQTNGSFIPCNAIQGGYTEKGEPLYIGRAAYQGLLVVGKVVPSEGKLYIPAWGVVSFDEYAILVQN